MKNIKELREFLGETMRQLRDGTLDVNKAKTISDLGQTIVNSAKVEVDFIKEAKVKDATDFISDGIIRSLPQLEDKPKGFVRPKAEYGNEQHDDRLRKHGS